MIAMFHVKHTRRPRHAKLLAAVLVLAFIGAGCVRIAEPDGWPAPAVTADGLVITQFEAGRVAAVDPIESRPVWIFPDHLPGGPAGREGRPEMGGIYATPVVDGNSIYVVSYEGMLTRIEAENSRIDSPWFTLLHERVVATPVLQDGRLYVGTERGNVIVVDAESGAVENRFNASEGRIWGRPALNGGVLYVPDLDARKTVALDVTTGEQIWEQGLTGASAADLVLDGDLLYVGSLDRAVHALDVNDGKERWRFQGDGWFVGPPLVDRDRLYAASMRGSVYAIDRAGNEIWRHTLDGEEFRSAPLLVDGTVIVGGRSGTVVGLDADTGAEQWRRTVDDVTVNAHGLLLNSHIFYITTDHELLRVDAGTGAVQRFAVVR